MTYPRTPEEKAWHLGARLACDAFNALGSLDAKLCQEVGTRFAAAIAELVRDVSWQEAVAKWVKAEKARDRNFMLFDRRQFVYARDFPGDDPITQQARLAYMFCHVCGKQRSTEVRELCGHDVDDGFGRRWYCSSGCFES